MTELITALDVPSYEDAMDFVDSLDGSVKWFKVGLELFISDGAVIMQALKREKFSVMLDLKLHDIPETVSRAVKTAIDLGADMLTLHASGGTKMMEAAAKAAEDRVKLLAVTVLTSLDHEDMRQLGIGMSTNEWANRLANFASLSRIGGLVCSAHEAKTIKDSFPDMTLVCPGIRPAGKEGKDDQKRVATPAFAREQGASFIVVGRPIRDVNPKVRPEVVKEILAELRGDAA